MILQENSVPWLCEPSERLVDAQLGTRAPGFRAFLACCVVYPVSGRVHACESALSHLRPKLTHVLTSYRLPRSFGSTDHIDVPPRPIARVVSFAVVKLSDPSASSGAIVS